MKKPPHMDLSKSDYRSNQDSGGYFPSLEDALQYEAKVKGTEYHSDRIRALKILVDQIDNPVKSVLDFGIGDGGTLLALDLKPSQIIGVDTSESMINLASTKLNAVAFNGYVGSIEQISNLDSESTDLVLCLNTLGYLDKEEQDLFFSESFRVLRTDGYLIVMTGNELFDLFALNSGTAEFFERHFNQNRELIADLLEAGSDIRFKNANRRNPLNFGVEMQNYGFREVDQVFCSWHKIVPAAAIQMLKGDLQAARIQARDLKFDLSTLPKVELWKRFFCCSIFASLLKK